MFHFLVSKVMEQSENDYLFGKKVKKYGCSTLWTFGEIVFVSFDEQCFVVASTCCGPFAVCGDSGAVVILEEGNIPLGIVSKGGNNKIKCIFFSAVLDILGERRMPRKRDTAKRSISSFFTYEKMEH
jgi:hypothetical protein